jgi:O-antigen ligase
MFKWRGLKTKFKTRVSTGLPNETALKIPNPVDIIMMLLFGWVLACVLLVLDQKQVLQTVSRLSKGREVRDAIVDGEGVIALTMLLGLLLIIPVVVTCHKYKHLLLPALLFSLSFSGAEWRPLYYSSFASRNIAIAFLLCFSGLFLLSNFWRLLSKPYIRVMLAYYIWIAVVCIAVGGRVPDLVYAALTMVFVVAIPMALFDQVNDMDKLMKINRAIAWVAVVVTCLHLLAPFVYPDWRLQGRFTSYSDKATAFGINYGLVVIAMFWMGMAEKNKYLSMFFQVMAMVGLMLIAWSGTRSAAGALIVSIFILWWFFRTRILLYGLLGVMLVLVAQIIGLTQFDDFQTIADRVSGAGDSGRIQQGRRYLKIIFRSPITGFGPNGVASEFLAKRNVVYLDLLGIEQKTVASHNAYLGMSARFGLVSLGLYLYLLYKAFLRAKEALLSKYVPIEQKQTYLLPVVILLVVVICSLAEDLVLGTGRGNPAVLLVFPMMILCERFGRLLVEKYPAPLLVERSRMEHLKPRARLRPGVVLERSTNIGVTVPKK